jgi:hypothetical protein
MRTMTTITSVTDTISFDSFMDDISLIGVSI